MVNRLRIGAWLFIFGSGLFVAEAVNELIHQVSFAGLVHLAEGLCFIVGSVYFLPRAEPER